jgi:peptidoglycan hydrolase-like protein with peptidoglycan-binding domain
MKHFLLCAALGAASLPVAAQAPVGSRALSSAEASRFDWPRYARLNHGDYNFQFAALQYLLRNQGFIKGTPDGTFDSMRTHPTERAVKAFQRANGLIVDGKVGSQTWAKLCPKLKRGDRGDAVRALQTLLDVKVDGSFGFGTETALRKFQQNRGLKADGIVGAQTWAVLLSPDEG